MHDRVCEGWNCSGLRKCRAKCPSVRKEEFGETHWHTRELKLFFHIIKLGKSCGILLLGISGLSHMETEILILHQFPGFLKKRHIHIFFWFLMPKKLTWTYVFLFNPHATFWNWKITWFSVWRPMFQYWNVTGNSYSKLRVLKVHCLGFSYSGTSSQSNYANYHPPIHPSSSEKEIGLKKMDNPTWRHTLNSEFIMILINLIWGKTNKQKTLRRAITRPLNFEGWSQRSEKGSSQKRHLS